MENDSRSNKVGLWALSALGLGTFASLAAVMAIPGKPGLVVALIILLLLVLFGSSYLLLIKLKIQQGSRRFLNWLVPDAARVPVEVKDAKRQVELDNLRKRFLEGVEVYRARGKDIYSVPWFVIIGESGSGKTEAIRHSNLDFPPGLNDFMQGTGGTINMDWWFTNHGVILDTAGSMVFPEAGGEGGGLRRWEEFIKMLKKHRAQCPINGLLLVLSVDSLISDSAAKIAEKAGKIARQLDLIQRTLDVRFPVSVLVTKCDMLTGFRECFEQIQDPDLQDQMVGWSNPDPLDQRFEPDKVDEYLEQVLQRLRKRRIGLLRDPLPTGGPRARRLDEVDALYALPKSLSLIAPRLRRYLETIFVAGEFSAKPVFLRGIYFTSAMQIGGDLDEAVWAALRRPDEVAGLPRTFEQLMAEALAAENSQVWERALQCYSEALRLQPGNSDCKKKVEDIRRKVQGGRPFFLRDLFLEKVFKERGLVTQATNTRLMLRQRKLTLIGVTSACLLVFLYFSYQGHRILRNQIGKQKDDWKAASTGNFPQIVTPGKSGQWIFNYEGAALVRDTNLVSPLSLVAFHQRFRQQAEQQLGSGIFYPLRLFANVESSDRRKKAQRVFFTHNVIRPLIDNTRLKMGQENPTNQSGEEIATAEFQRDALQDALKALIRLEADLVSGKQRLETTNPAVAATNYVLPYLGYLTETTNLTNVLDLSGVFVRTYADHWPVRSLTGGDNLATNRAIDYGLRRFFAHSLRANQQQKKQIDEMENISKRISEFEKQEKVWFQAAKNKTEITSNNLKSLEIAKKDLDLALASAQANFLFTHAGDTMESHLTHFREENSRSGSNAVSAIQAAMAGGPMVLTNTLFVQINSNLNLFLQQLSRGTVVSTHLLSSPGDLDANFLNFYGPEPVLRAYAYRFQMYTQAFALQGLLCPALSNEVGRAWAYLTNYEDTAVGVRKQCQPYDKGYATELRFTCNHLLDTGLARAKWRFVSDYGALVSNRLQDYAGLRAIQLADLTNLYSFAGGVMRDYSQREKLNAELQELVKELPTEIGKAKTSLTMRFLSVLESQMGFPVRRGTDRELSLNEILELEAQISPLSEVLSRLLRSDPQDPLVSLAGRVEKWRRVLNFLCGTNQTERTYYIEVNRLENPQFRGLAVSEDTNAPVTNITVGLVRFGPFRLNGRLVIDSRRFDKQNTLDNPPLHRVEIREWAALRLIDDQKYKPTKANGNPRRWNISFLGDPESGQTVTLVLVFDDPLPSEWLNSDGP
jgi:tetratricopeptide (TPR) repeat protein